MIALSLSVWMGNAAAAPTFTNGQAADLVLGQSSFTTNTSGCNATSLANPRSVAIDPTTGKVFVADGSNNRVVRFASAASLASGAAAEAVLGQPDLTTCTSGITQAKMNGVSGVSMDNAGRLWVADLGNNRVLRFDGAASIASGANANGVLGQPDFVTDIGATSVVKMNNPYGVFADANGRVWVPEYSNKRVTRFDNAAAKANGAAADGVLGQPDFVTNTSATSQTSINGTQSAFLDSGGRLWVGGYSSKRVMRFDNAATLANGAAMDAVLGQPDFTSSTSTTTATGMGSNVAVLVDPAGNLYVGDYGNQRILIFNNAAAKATGAAADYVLGQTDFVTSGTGLTATKLNMGGSISSFAWHAGTNTLWVPDQSNNRVLRFTIAAPAPVNAPVDLHFSKQVETFATEIELKF